MANGRVLIWCQWQSRQRDVFHSRRDSQRLEEVYWSWVTEMNLVWCTIGMVYDWDGVRSGDGLNLMQLRIRSASCEFDFGWTYVATYAILLR